MRRRNGRVLANVLRNDMTMPVSNMTGMPRWNKTVSLQCMKMDRRNMRNQRRPKIVEALLFLIRCQDRASHSHICHPICEFFSISVALKLQSGGLVYQQAVPCSARCDRRIMRSVDLQLTRNLQ